ncbi:MAG: conjugal transfer protein TraH, partial [Alphaproteobacteria bacterium]|nr:conjugal transfer protein TraH [Alphaproteobacteria bacterium]
MIFPKQIALFISILMLNATSGSDISSSLTSFFNKMGLPSNVTPPALFKDQAAGYATGGGMSFSGNVMDSKLAH